MTLLKIILESKKTLDVNKTIDDIRDLVKSCVPDTSIENPKANADFNIGVGYFMANLNQKGLLITK